MTETPTKTTTDLAQEAAVDAVALLSAARWTAVHRLFDPTLATRVPPPQLRSSWIAATAGAGTYLGPGTLRVHVTEAYTVTDIPLRFSSARLYCRVTCDEVGRIAGIFLTRDAMTPATPALLPGATAAHRLDCLDPERTGAAAD